MRIGFVGLGRMGTPMARNLIRAGHALFIHGRDAATRDALAREGAEVGASVREIAGEVDVFCSCRVTPQQSRATFIGPDGVAQAGKPGMTCVDFATVDPETSRAIAAALDGKKIGFLDAPVSGRPQGARDGTLTVIVGGPKDHFERAKPAFEAIGKQIFHMGPAGSGVAAKLCNNSITITLHALLAEAMVFGVKSGIDPRRLYEVLLASSAGSNTMERVVRDNFLPRNFSAAGTIGQIMKDLECAVGSASALGARLRLPDLALELYREAAAQGHTDKDISAVILPMEAAAGVQVGPA